MLSYLFQYNNILGFAEEFKESVEIVNLYSKLGYSYVERKCTKLLEQIEVIIKHELNAHDESFFYSAHDDNILTTLLGYFNSNDMDNIQEKLFDELNETIEYNLIPNDTEDTSSSLNKEKQTIHENGIIREISENLSKMRQNIKENGYTISTLTQLSKIKSGFDSLWKNKEHDSYKKTELDSLIFDAIYDRYISVY